MDTNKSYKVICDAYYCGWESDIYDKLEDAEAIDSCPRCNAKRKDLRIELC